jgi:hypothetical protein
MATNFEKLIFGGLHEKHAVGLPPSRRTASNISARTVQKTPFLIIV